MPLSKICFEIFSKSLSCISGDILKTIGLDVSDMKATKINDKYINTSAKNIKNKLSIKTWKKKGIVFIDDAVVEDTEKAALILPDGNAESPAFLVFDNYEKILMWNRSLRFGVTVCTLSNLIKDEI